MILLLFDAQKPDVSDEFQVRPSRARTMLAMLLETVLMDCSCFAPSMLH